MVFIPKMWRKKDAVKTTGDVVSAKPKDVSPKT